MRFILARHGRTVWNLEERVQGQSDIELCEEGRQDAEKLAEALLQSKIPIDKIVSSPLKRAVETAKIVVAKIKTALSFDDELEECFFGDLEGLTISEIEARIGRETLDKLLKDFLTYDFGQWGGESGKRVFQRHIKALKRIFVSGNRNTTALLIGHCKGLGTLLFGLGHANPVLESGEFRVMKYP